MRPNNRFNLATTIPVTPYYTEDETSNTRTFGDILVVQNANLPEREFPLTRGQTNENNSHYDNITEELKISITPIPSNASPSYFFIDAHISADTIQYLQYASTRKHAGYTDAWKKFQTRTAQGNARDVEIMALFKQINHRRNGQPEVLPFGINYDGSLDKDAMKVMTRLAAAKYPEDPTNRSYQISQQRWIGHYVRQLQLAISNGAAPAISCSFCKLLATSTDLILQNLEDLDPPRENIPAFSNGTEVHEDKTAYESLDRRGTVIATQGPIFHDQQSRDMPTQNDPGSDNGFIPVLSDEETSPSLIRKETATSSSPSTSPSLIRHDDGTPPPRTDPTKNDQDFTYFVCFFHINNYHQQLPS